jgi:hypothetical protein
VIPDEAVEPYPFQRGDRVTHPSRPGLVGTLEAPEVVWQEREPRLYVWWDDGQGTRVSPQHLTHEGKNHGDD